MTICFPMPVLSKSSLTNGMFHLELGLESSDICLSCKILRDATPKSLVILDGMFRS